MVSPQTAPTPGAAPVPAQEIQCQGCGLRVPTKLVTIYQNIGMVMARQTTETSGNFCRRCIRKYVVSYSLTTLVLGWWGMISFIMTPFLLVANVIVYLKSLSLPEPDLLAAGVTNQPNFGPQLGSQTWKFVVAACLVVVLLGVVGYYNVDFVERHFPAFNALVHSGEITEDSDAEYVGVRISQDMEALGVPFKSKDWEGMREELLAREKYLSDLQVQNAKLQRAGRAEVANHNVGSSCEQLALDEYLPALDAYTKALTLGFQRFKDAPHRTTAAAAAINDAGDQQDLALDRIRKYVADRKARGCDNNS